jgi:hypothetical protein
VTARPQSETTNGREPRAGTRGQTGGMRSQVLFRDLNEQLRSLAKGFGLDAEFDLVCECTNGGCFERVTIRLGEYEAIRRFPTRFVVKPGHAANGVERIAEETSYFLVVEKIGPDAETAILLDPRKYGSQEELIA